MIIVDSKRVAVDFRTPGAIAAGTDTEANSGASLRIAPSQGAAANGEPALLPAGAAKISCTYSDGEAKSKASCVLVRAKVCRSHL